jgi:hypothetical protein
MAPCPSGAHGARRLCEGRSPEPGARDDRSSQPRCFAVNFYPWLHRLHSPPPPPPPRPPNDGEGVRYLSSHHLGGAAACRWSTGTDPSMHARTHARTRRATEHHGHGPPFPARAPAVTRAVARVPSCASVLVVRLNMDMGGATHASGGRQPGTVRRAAPVERGWIRMCADPVSASQGSSGSGSGAPSPDPLCQSEFLPGFRLGKFPLCRRCTSRAGCRCCPRHSTCTFPPCLYCISGPSLSLSLSLSLSSLNLSLSLSSLLARSAKATWNSSKANNCAPFA